MGHAISRRGFLSAAAGTAVGGRVAVASAAVRKIQAAAALLAKA
jgi:hypothetical protein